MLVSTIVPLRVEYSPDAPGEAPTRLLLKARARGSMPTSGPIGEREVAFYTRAAPLMPGGPLPRCYDAEYSSGRFHLLLEDLSETHMVFTEWPIPPTGRSVRADRGHVGDLPRVLVAPPTARTGGRHVPRRRGAGEDGSGLSGTLRTLRGSARRPARVASPSGLCARAQRARASVHAEAPLPTYTLAHGDAHVWNLLYPRDAAAGIYLIDWDAWRIGRGAFDLAYMMAVHWYPERRARLEAPLIERYHAGLLAHGVTDYGLDQLREDYRLAVIAHLATPVWQQSLGLPPTIWWPHLHRILAAFEDLDCAALLS